MNKNVRLGILIVSGSVLVILGLFAIGDRSFLFSDTISIRTQFGSVAGLQSGAAVQYQGVSVGRVQQVLLPEDPGGNIEVTMSISQRAQDLIRENTQAQIKSAGIVGEQIVVLVNPEDPGEPVDEGAYIPGVDPFDLFEITDRTLASVRGFEGAADAFEQIMLDIQDGEGTLGRVIYDSTLYLELVATTNETRRIMEGLATTAEASADVLVDLASEAQASLTAILEKAESGDGTIAKFLNDPAIYNAFLATTDTLKTIADDLRSVSQSADNAVTWGELGAFRFAELMEAAKHNWLFKRYFEERGSIEMAPFEVRERAISQSFEQINERERELLLWEERLREWEARLADSDSLDAGPGNVGGGEGDSGGDSEGDDSGEEPDGDSGDEAGDGDSGY